MTLKNGKADLIQETIVIAAGTTAMGPCSGGERLAQLQIQQQKVGI